MPAHKLLTYATTHFRLPAWTLARSARRFGIEPTIHGPSDPSVRQLASAFPDLMASTTGAGYWLWKPTIILDALKRAKAGDIVIYSDAAAVLIADPAPLLSLTDQHPILLFELGDRFPMRTWTKRDCFVALSADTPNYWNMAQLVGGLQIYRVGAEALAFVEAVAAACQMPGVLDDTANTRGRPNHPDFVAHRHDQAVLSIVARQHGIAVFPDPSQFGPRAPRPAQDESDGWRRPEAPYGQIFIHHRMTNREMIRKYLSGRFVWSRTTGRLVWF